jgi:UDP-2-acetamido-2,6-beta-L-arabino-hexul-4-ose reductase
MEPRATVEEVFVHRDARGFVFEPLAPGKIALQQNAHVVLTEPGCVRGNHYHRIGTETLIVFGPALVRVRDGSTLEDIAVSEGKAIRFTIPPGVSHAVKNTGDGLNLLVAFNSLAHEPEEPDVVADILIEV